MNLFTRLKLKYSSPFKRALIFKSLGIRIGDNCQIFSEVSFGSEPYLIDIEDNVEITVGVSFITHDWGLNVLRNLRLLENADYFGKISIGDNCVIGASSIVTRSIPSNSVAAGVPVG